MMYLVAYDIELDKNRNKIAKLLLKIGLERVQYSVFIGPLTEWEYGEIQEKIEILIKEDPTYSVLFLPLHNDMIQSIVEVSSNKLDWEYLKGEKTIMIL
jgi:CRISPR-associated protein Cas2